MPAAKVRAAPIVAMGKVPRAVPVVPAMVRTLVKRAFARRSCPAPLSRGMAAVEAAVCSVDTAPSAKAMA